MSSGGALVVGQSISMTGGQILVQSGGTLMNYWSPYDLPQPVADWSNNKASLYVATGAVVDSYYDPNGGITVDALTGGGTVQHTVVYAPEDLTVGVNNGSGTFTGSIADDGHRLLNLVKAGSGIQVLAGSNPYHGTTTVSGGTLSFTANNGFPQGGGYGQIYIGSGAMLLTDAPDYQNTQGFGSP